MSTMLFPVLDNNSPDELFFEWAASLPPEYVNFSGWRSNNHQKVEHWTRSYERNYNASGYYYTFLRERIEKDGYWK